METEDRFTPARADCPHPERWHSPDPDSTEVEVSALAASFVRALRPDLVVETGTAFGQTAGLIGEVLREDDYGGRMISFEVDGRRVTASRLRLKGLPVEVVQRPSLEGLATLKNAQVGFAWLDSLFDLRIPELRLVAPLMISGGIIGIHDCGEPGHTKYGKFSEKVSAEAGRLGLRRISLPTPRGVTFLQKW